ncbi:unnamed protein product [Mycena citricolor]|uniref:F-box domain-containing protein n=1 Tax=Mycena citricolor TaxID=2018698 RepID=A0AAD2H8F6_9AGAR|nr:unnamed protein product [Mycena citricolor]
MQYVQCSRRCISISEDRIGPGIEFNRRDTCHSAFVNSVGCRPVHPRSIHSVHCRPMFFPRELEFQIFEKAALSSPKDIPRFVLVARRLPRRLQALLYHALTDAVDLGRIPFMNAQKISDILDDPSSNAFAHIQNVMLSDLHGDALDRLLLASPALRNIFLCTMVSEPPTLARLMHLRQLHCRWLDLPYVRRMLPDALSQTCPALTHLAMNDDLPITQHLADEHVWNAAPTLQAIVLLWARQAVFDALLGEDIAILESDVRVVGIFVPNFGMDWQRGCPTEQSFWTAADSWIARRRSGDLHEKAWVVDYATED